MTIINDVLKKLGLINPLKSREETDIEKKVDTLFREVVFEAVPELRYLNPEYFFMSGNAITSIVHDSQDSTDIDIFFTVDPTRLDCMKPYIAEYFPKRDLVRSPYYDFLSIKKDLKPSKYHYKQVNLIFPLIKSRVILESLPSEKLSDEENAMSSVLIENQRGGAAQFDMTTKESSLSSNQRKERADQDNKSLAVLSKDSSMKMYFTKPKAVIDGFDLYHVMWYMQYGREMQISKFSDGTTSMDLVKQKILKTQPNSNPTTKATTKNSIAPGVAAYTTGGHSMTIPVFIKTQQFEEAESDGTVIMRSSKFVLDQEYSMKKRALVARYMKYIKEYGFTPDRKVKGVLYKLGTCVEEGFTYTMWKEIQDEYLGAR